MPFSIAHPDSIEFVSRHAMHVFNDGVWLIIEFVSTSLYADRKFNIFPRGLWPKLPPYCIDCSSCIASVCRSKKRCFMATDLRWLRTRGPGSDTHGRWSRLLRGRLWACCQPEHGYAVFVVEEVGVHSELIGVTADICQRRPRRSRSIKAAWNSSWFMRFTHIRRVQSLYFMSSMPIAVNVLALLNESPQQQEQAAFCISTSTLISGLTTAMFFVWAL